MRRQKVSAVIKGEVTLTGQSDNSTKLFYEINGIKASVWVWSSMQTVELTTVPLPKRFKPYTLIK